MALTSLRFAAFLPAAVILFHLTPLSKRRLVLFFISCVFYGLWSIPYLALLVLLTTVAYFSALHIQAATDLSKKRKILKAALISCLGVLVFFKCTGLLGQLAVLAGRPDYFQRILVPLGISYYTFKLVGYILDVYWEKIPAENDFISLNLYAAFFPQILSGPIQRPDDFLRQIKHPVAGEPRQIVSGLRLILFGYFKKIIVADSLGLIIAKAFNHPESYNSLWILFCCYAFAVQLYADFSGFTDIARGTGRLFGIESPINFNMPFYAMNLQEFWRRWHMTLTRWMADYVFTPLRMFFRSRGTQGLLLAVSINFIAIGLWHGVALRFLAFGVLHAFCLCVSVLTLRQRDAFFERHSYLAWARRIWAPAITFQIWTVSQILFRVDSLPHANRILMAILEFNLSKPRDSSILWSPGFCPVMWWLVLPSLVMEIVHWAQYKGHCTAYFESKPTAIRWAAYYAVMLLCLFYLKHGSQEFIYAKF